MSIQWKYPQNTAEKYTFLKDDCVWNTFLTSLHNFKIVVDPRKYNCGWEGEGSRCKYLDTVSRYCIPYLDTFFRKLIVTFSGLRPAKLGLRFGKFRLDKVRKRLDIQRTQLQLWSRQSIYGCVFHWTEHLLHQKNSFAKSYKTISSSSLAESIFPIAAGDPLDGLILVLIQR